MKTVKQLQTERVKNRCQQINLIKKFKKYKLYFGPLVLKKLRNYNRKLFLYPPQKLVETN